MSSPPKHIMHIGEKRASDTLMDTPEYATMQLCQLCYTVDSQDVQLTTILQKSSIAANIIHSLHNKVAGLESDYPVALQKNIPSYQ
jgi:hypothetical protein